MIILNYVNVFKTNSVRCQQRFQEDVKRKIVAATVAVSVSASTYASASALTSNAAVFVACVAAAASHGGKIHCRLLVSID